MNQSEYVSIRRAYNLVRQNVEASDRLAFPELAILCHLMTQDSPQSTASIATYQHALRPTMTHRTKHLVSLGLVDRCKSDSDRRNVNCTITDAGRAFVEQVCEGIRLVLRQGDVLSRTTAQRIVHYADAMGTIQCGSSELVVIRINQRDDGCTVGELAKDLGFLQPTMSMAIAKLERSGLVIRAAGETGHSTRLSLTESGKQLAQELKTQIEAVVVRREGRRSAKKRAAEQ